jgi:hypothetical protein
MEQLVGVVGIFGASMATALQRTLIDLLAWLVLPIVAPGPNWLVASCAS